MNLSDAVCVFFFVLSCRGVEISNFLINRQYYQESSQYNIVDFCGRFGHFRISNVLFHTRKKNSDQTKLIGMCFFFTMAIQFTSDQPNAKVYTHVITKWFCHCFSSHKMNRTICPSHAFESVCESKTLFAFYVGLDLDFRIRIVVMNIVEWGMYVPVAHFRNLFHFQFVNRLLYVSTTSIKTTHLMFEADSNGSFRAHKIFRILCNMLVAYVKL